MTITVYNLFYFELKFILLIFLKINLKYFKIKCYVYLFQDLLMSILTFLFFTNPIIYFTKDSAYMDYLLERSVIRLVNYPKTKSKHIYYIEYWFVYCNIIEA